MGNEHQAAGVARQVILKPEQRFEIEMVGGLIEQQERRLTDKQTGEMGAHDPAAREGLGLFIVIAFTKPKTSENFFGAGLERPIDVVVIVVFRHEFLAAGGDG